MILEALKSLDRTTANNILAATALSTSPNPGLDDAEVVKRYRSEVSAVVDELRRRLQLSDTELNTSDRRKFNETLSRLIADNVFADGNAQEALARAGQAGRLSPTYYKIEQPRPFVDVFYRYGLKKRTIEDAIHRADDFQHLMNEDAVERDAISLFVKRMLPTDRPPHWLLVQTHRRGAALVAQSAWRLYPDDVDLTRAREPIDLLKAFVDAFGLPVRVDNGNYSKFVERQVLQGDPSQANWHFQLEVPNATKRFASVSHVKSTTPGRAYVGVGYCIDLTKYEAALRKRGFNV